MDKEIKGLEAFMHNLIASKETVALYLTNGVRLFGSIKWVELEDVCPCLCLAYRDKEQIVMLNTVGSILPEEEKVREVDHKQTRPSNCW